MSVRPGGRIQTLIRTGLRAGSPAGSTSAAGAPIGDKAGADVPAARFMASLSSSPVSTYRGRFGESEATRLLWRAGFGPRRGDPRRLVALGLEGAVASLTRPSGPARLIGSAPHDDHGQPLDPINVWGQDHCWWLDRMVRSDQQLVERMTLIWHSWFATSVQASTSALMLRQNRMMRARALGNFHDLLVEVTKDPAMLLWLSGTANTKYSPNENYGREMMELFTLGADRGYSQHDVHAQARALTGFTNELERYAAARTSSISIRRCTTPASSASSATAGALTTSTAAACASSTRTTRRSRSASSGTTSSPSRRLGTSCGRWSRPTYARGYEIRPLVEAILRHPLFYAGARMVIPPVGLLRRDAARARAHDHHRHWAGSASRPDSGCSTRRTWPAGTTRTGSTRHAGRAASRRSTMRCRARRSTRPRPGTRLTRARRRR